VHLARMKKIDVAAIEAARLTLPCGPDAEVPKPSNFAWQKSVGPNVRFGSKADMTLRNRDVRYSPKSGYSERSLGCGF
jgi:hypothetical protein